MFRSTSSRLPSLHQTDMLVVTLDSLAVVIKNHRKPGPESTICRLCDRGIEHPSSKMSHSFSTGLETIVPAQRLLLSWSKAQFTVIFFDRARTGDRV